MFMGVKVVWLESIVTVIVVETIGLATSLGVDWKVAVSAL